MPKKYEGKIINWFDSPYPPHKLSKPINYPVAIKGASLTAIDAIKTIARHNGKFTEDKDGRLTYQLNKDSRNCRIVLHSLNGLLPAVRFHLEDPNLGKGTVMNEETIREIKRNNGGFVPLDYIFEKYFLEPLHEQQPAFYRQVCNMKMEAFVDYIMGFRERMDAFELFKAEYAEAEKSIKRKQSVYWKELLAVLSYSMNYPAKHFSAEDMLRLKKVLMPLISIVIAFVPQGSCREIIALHNAGFLSLIDVDNESNAEPLDKGGAMYTYNDKKIAYEMYIDAVGQPQFNLKEFPFESLRNNGGVSTAQIQFNLPSEAKKEIEKGNKLVELGLQGNYYLKVSGININDNFQIIDDHGAYNERIYIMAVPFIGGLNPDYSGLDFCETASEKIVKALQQLDLKPVKSEVA